MVAFYTALKGFQPIYWNVDRPLMLLQKMVKIRYLIVLSAVFFLTACTDEQTTFLEADQSFLAEYDQIAFFQAKDKQGHECDDEKRVICATVDIRYPEFVKAHSENIRSLLNQHVIDVILNGDYETLDTKAENVEQLAFLFMQQFKIAPFEADWTLQQDVSVIWADEQLLSIESQRNEYAGGAHGSNRVDLMTVDLATGNLLSLNKAFKLGYESELNSLADAIFRQLNGLTLDDDYEANGFSFAGNQFALNDNFAFVKNGIRFYFNPYEVAAYARGPTDLLIPYKDIAHLIKPDGFFSKVAGSAQ